jgi:hypothetical protein
MVVSSIPVCLTSPAVCCVRILLLLPLGATPPQAFFSFVVDDDDELHHVTAGKQRVAFLARVRIALVVSVLVVGRGAVPPLSCSPLTVLPFSSPGIFVLGLLCENRRATGGVETTTGLCSLVGRFPRCVRVSVSCVSGWLAVWLAD